MSPSHTSGGIAIERTGHSRERQCRRSPARSFEILRRRSKCKTQQQVVWGGGTYRAALGKDL